MQLRFEPEGHKYFIETFLGEKRVPSVTQIICEAIGNPFRFVDRDILDRACAFGSAVHTAIKYHLQNRLNESTIDPEILPYFNAAKAFINAYMDFITFVEKPMHRSDLFAGTPDIIGRLKRDGRLAVIDWKSGHIDKFYCAMQTAAYEDLYRCTTGYKKIMRRFTVQLLPDGAFKVFEFTDITDKSQFFQLLKGATEMNQTTETSMILPEVPTENKLLPQAQSILNQAKNFDVSSVETYQSATEYLKVIKKSAKAVETERKRYIDPINEKKNEVQAYFKPVVDLVAQAEEIIKSKIIAYDKEQQRIAEELIAKKAAKQRRLAEILEQDMKQAEEAGNIEHAQLYDRRIRELETQATAVPVNQHKQNVSGVHVMITYKPVITDINKAISACISDERLRHLVTIDQVALNKFATAHKDTYPIDGIVFEKKESVCARTA